MGKAVKRLFFLGVLAGVGYAVSRAVWRAVQGRMPAPNDEIAWETAPFPFPPVPRPSTAVVTDLPASNGADVFVDPGDDGACPLTHPVKAKLASGIYHVPGGGNYERTKPDRCYVSAEAAEADGLRPAKR